MSKLQLLNGIFSHDFTPQKTNMTIEKQQFEDISPTNTGDFPL